MQISFAFLGALTVTSKQKSAILTDYIRPTKCLISALVAALWISFFRKKDMTSKIENNTHFSLEFPLL